MTALALDPPSPHAAYLLRLADDQLILGHRLSEWTGHAPMLEEDIALANIALDHIGAARSLYDHAGAVHAKESAAGTRLSEDDLAYRRDTRGYMNCLLVERPNGDFAHTMVRQFLYSAFAVTLWQALSTSRDATLSAIAQKSVKEARYHVRHAGDWVVRLGDGTQESTRRTVAALEALWPYTDELFETDEVLAHVIERGIGADPEALRGPWQETVEGAISAAGLSAPTAKYMQSGGRTGRHSEHLGAIPAEMQAVHREHPGATW